MAKWYDEFSQLQSYKTLLEFDSGLSIRIIKLILDLGFFYFLCVRVSVSLRFISSDFVLCRKMKAGDYVFYGFKFLLFSGVTWVPASCVRL